MIQADMKINFKKTIFLLVIGFSFLSILPASAALVPCNGPDCSLCLFMRMVSDIVLFIVRDITAPLAGLLFLIGGIMMVSAGGNETRFKKGRDVFKSTIIGVLIVLASWAIVNTLITTFGSNVAGFVPGNWWQVQCVSPPPASSTAPAGDCQEQTCDTGFSWNEANCECEPWLSY